MRLFLRSTRQAEVATPGANTSGVPFCRYCVYDVLKSFGATDSSALSAVTGRARPSVSFANAGSSDGVTTARYDAFQTASGPVRTKAISQLVSCFPLSWSRLESVFARNQRGQPAFFGMRYVASVSSSGRWFALPSGLFFCRARRPAWLIAPSAPVTRSASNAGS